jgi:hypothetical protein
VKLTFVFQILNTMNLIWAFDFDLARNPETKEVIPVNVWDFERVCLPLRMQLLSAFLATFNRAFSLDQDHSSAKLRSETRRKQR